MTAYWLYFFIPLAGVISPLVLVGRARLIGWALLLLVSVIFLGLRNEIGGDWDNYLHFSERTASENFSFVFQSRDSGYVLLNWISAKWGWGIFGTNLACAGLFLGGLAFFCNRQPHPILAWLVATPYLIVVVGMGYTRQSVAIGLAMAAINFLEQKRGWKFLGLILVAATFHKSALLLLPLVLFLVTKDVVDRSLSVFRRGLVSRSVLGGSFVGITLVVGLAARHFDLFVSEFQSYILSGNWNSEGGVMRAAMNVIPALFLIINWRRWSVAFGSGNLWLGLSLLALVVFFSAPFISTFADRIGLYLICLQIYVVSRVPVLIEDNIFRGLVTAGVSCLYAVVLFVWLNYASHAYYWIPYQSLILP